jgi:uncharacterized membrane protein
MPWLRRRRRPPEVPTAVKHNIGSVTQLEQEFARQRSTLDRISDNISAFVGSLQFIFAHGVIFGAWIVLNTPWVLGERAFDPYPYVFLNFVLAVEAVFLGTFVLMSQNRQNRQAEERAHLDLQIGLLAEQETTKTLQMLQRISERLGLQEVSKDKELAQMIETTHVEIVAHELQKAREPEGAPAP